MDLVVAFCANVTMLPPASVPGKVSSVTVYTGTCIGRPPRFLWDIATEQMFRDIGAPQSDPCSNHDMTTHDILKLCSHQCDTIYYPRT